jgi:hypothetical protein
MVAPEEEAHMPVPGTFETVGVVGHKGSRFTRDARLWTQDALDQTIHRVKDENGVLNVATTCEIGVGSWGSHLARGAELDVHAFVPWIGYRPRGWTKREYDLYVSELARAKEVRAFADTPEGDAMLPSPTLVFNERNEALVVASELLIAVSTLTQDGGAANAIGWAICDDRPVILINPKRRSITVPSKDQLAAWFPDSQLLAVEAA